MRKRLYRYIAIIAILLGIGMGCIGLFLFKQIQVIRGADLDKIPLLEDTSGISDANDDLNIMSDDGEFDLLIGNERFARLSFAAELTTLLIPLVTLIVLTIASGFILGAIVIRRSVKPIEELTSWISRHDASEVDPPDFKDPELQFLSQSLKETFTVHKLQLERESTFVREASHELYTPISVIRAVCELAEKKPLSDTEMNRVRRSAKRMENTVEGLLCLARAEQQVSGADFEKEIHSLKDELIDTFKSSSISLAIQIDWSPTNSLSSRMLVIAAGTLLRNAYQHSNSTQIALSLNEKYLEIRDNGKGVENLQEIQSSLQELQPCIHNGTGLFLVERICRRMDWEFSIDSLESGSVARLTF